MLDAEATSVSVSLDSLNPKQRAKEYKAAVKDVKNKDLEVKMKALDRFNADCRYYTEGGCFVPLIECIAPKKKVTDIQKIALDALLRFFEAQDPKMGGQEAALSALKAIVAAQGSLKSLEVLANLMLFREEVKKSKVKSPKKKKGEEEPPEAPPVVEENPVVVELRRDSLKALYYISVALSLVDRSDSSQILDHFSAVPNLISNLSSLLINEFLVKFKDPESRSSVIQEGIWALQVMVSLLKGSMSEETLQSLLASGFIDVLPSLLEEGEFALSCAQVMEVMAESSCGFSRVLEDNNMGLLLDLLTTASAAVASYAPSSGSAAPAPAKGKAAAPVAEVTAAPVHGAGESLRLPLSQIKVVSKIFTSVARRQGSALTDDTAARIVAGISSALAVKEIAEPINSRGQGSAESLSLADFVDVCCILIGEMSVVSTQLRRTVCTAGGAAAVCAVLRQSEELVLALGDAAGNNEGAMDSVRRRRLFELRHVAGKAVLAVLSEAATDYCARPSSSPSWSAYRRYKTDEALFDEQVAGARFDVSPLVELLGRDDEGLANCAARLLCLIINGAEDVQAFLAVLGADAMLPKLAALVDDRCDAVCTQLSAQLAGEAADDARRDLVDGLLPSAAEALYMSLSIAGGLMGSSGANVASFATVGRLTALSGLLRLGAAGAHSWEFSVQLPDPRDHPWLVADELRGELAREQMLFRPLLLDVLAIAARSGSLAARDEEGKVTADSPSLESALCVALLCGDASLLCISPLSGCSLRNGRRIAPVALPVDSVAHIHVLLAALRLLEAVGSCGARGLCALVESIASAHKASLGSESAGECGSVLSPLLQALREGGAGDDLDERAAAWARPVRYDDVFPEGEDPLERSAGWPFFALARCLAGVVMTPALGSTALELALRALDGLCMDRYTRAEAPSQPVVCDIFCAAFVSLGGLVAMSGALGRFGTSYAAFARGGVAVADAGPRESALPLGLALMRHLVRRGADREAFWRDYAAAELEPAAAEPALVDPKAKAAAKAEPPKGATPAPAKSGPPSLVPEVQLLCEPDSSHPDPNHGPAAQQWLALLNEQHSDLEHTRCELTSPLLSCIQGGLSDVALELVRAGVDCNAGEASSGRSPLMFALLLGDEQVVRELMQTPGLDLDALDGDRNPLLKYACASVLPQYMAHIPCGTALDGLPAVEVPPLEGQPAFLHWILASKVDTCVSDADGNGPVMWCLGQCELRVLLRGCLVRVSNWAYLPSCAQPPALLVARLRECGAQTDSCNRRGVAPIHIAAARGDVDLMEELVSRSGANPTSLDAKGNLPLHYLAAACPDNALIAFDALCELSQYKCFERKEFHDGRTGLSPDDKFAIDFERSLSGALAEAVSPSVIAMRRVSTADLLLALNDEALSMLQLCMCAHALQPAEFCDNQAQYLNHIRGSKNERIALALKIAAHATEVGVSDALLSNVAKRGMSTLHASALMLQGRSVRVELTAQQRRSRKVRYYECAELELLDKLRLGPENCTADVDLPCEYPLRAFDNQPWNALQCALAFCNEDLAADLFERSSASARRASLYLHLLCGQPPGSFSEAFLEALVAGAPQHFDRDLLNCPYAYNAPSSRRVLTPLMHAISSRNALMVRLLGRLPQIDPNCAHDNSLPYNAACCNACDSDDADALHTLRAFDGPLFDRLDLTLADGSGETCVHVLLRRDRLDLLAELLRGSKRNDIITVLLATDRYCNCGESLLYQAERENHSLACQCGVRQQEPATEGEGEEGDAEGRRREVLAAEAAPDLLRSERKVKMMLEAVVSTGVVSSDAHFLDMYHQGQTFAEFQLGVGLEENFIM